MTAAISTFSLVWRSQVPKQKKIRRKTLEIHSCGNLISFCQKSALLLKVVVLSCQICYVGRYSYHICSLLNKQHF